MIAASHPFLTHDPIVWVTTISGMAVTWITLYFRVIRPRAQEHQRHEEERNQKRRETDAFLYGVRPIDGVTEETLSAPRRLRAVEMSVAAVVSSNQKLVTSVDGLTDRMNEANGTGKRTEGKVDALSGLVKNVIAAGVEAKLVTGNGETHEVALTPETHDAIIEAIKEA